MRILLTTEESSITNVGKVVMSQTSLDKRNSRIVAEYAKDRQTIRSIGARHGLTPERVRQILTHQGSGTRRPGPRPQAGRVRPRPLSLQDRFFKHIEIVTDDAGQDHWVWKRTAGHGYGTFRLGGVLQYAHRAAFFLIRGRRPSRLKKICMVRSCVNPVCWQEWSADIQEVEGTH